MLLLVISPCVFCIMHISTNPKSIFESDSVDFVISNDSRLLWINFSQPHCHLLLLQTHIIESIMAEWAYMDYSLQSWLEWSRVLGFYVRSVCLFFLINISFYFLSHNTLPPQTNQLAHETGISWWKICLLYHGLRSHKTVNKLFRLFCASLGNTQHRSYHGTWCQFYIMI